ncbi:MAG: S-methyl-5'-thioadenosine phosphorylase [Chloroflexi bacterium]|nr:S-methyl-5'-thioadenosine phosphorylase [Chloroflexota bacterium]MDA1227439.1 S-methyl-5'-thioadenosine phosphorylase [Chloroflexota bacterium]
MTKAKIAFIGGSGLYHMDGLEERREVDISTPFGSPSDSIVTGSMSGVGVAFLPRHGKGHRLSPTELPSHANIYALKTLGVEQIISISAVGSLKESVRPLDLLIPDQLIDRTRSRNNTFFDNGIVAHIGFADPFCPVLSEVLAQSARDQNTSVHAGGTYVVMEGPQFSTRAESELYRSWGASVIGMTALPEAKLAREAEICYATIALVTDYDVWHQSEEEVSVELVIANLLQNVDTSRQIIADIVTKLPQKRVCACESALRDAIITDRNHISAEAKERLAPLVSRYL